MIKKIKTLLNMKTFNLKPGFIRSENQTKTKNFLIHKKIAECLICKQRSRTEFDESFFLPE